MENLSQARSLLTYTGSQAAAMVKPSAASRAKRAEPEVTRTLASPTDRIVREQLEKMMDRWEREQIEIGKAFDRELERLGKAGPGK